MSVFTRQYRFYYGVNVSYLCTHLQKHGKQKGWTYYEVAIYCEITEAYMNFRQVCGTWLSAAEAHWGASQMRNDLIALNNYL